MELQIVKSSYGIFIISVLLTIIICVYWDHSNLISPFQNFARSDPIQRESTFASSYSKDLEGPARELINSFKEKTRQVLLASGFPNGEDNDFTAEEIDAWNRHNPCGSRTGLQPMYESRKYANQLAGSQALWDELLVEYSKLHRTCLRSIGDVSEYFLSRNRSTGCQFVISAFTSGTGFGNKVLVSASALLYAIVTRRVLLIPSDTLLPSSMCEPFLGSSWVLNSSAFPAPNFTHTASPDSDTSWTIDSAFSDQIDAAVVATGVNATALESLDGAGFAELAAGTPPVATHGVWSDQWQPPSRFFCTADQAFYSHIEWLRFAGCIYTFPKLFASPVFRPTLEALFPDRMALTRMLRSVFLPADAIWTRVQRIDREDFAGAERRLGVQIRWRWGAAQYRQLSDLVNRRVVDCARLHGLLPVAGGANDTPAPISGGPESPTSTGPEYPTSAGIESPTSGGPESPAPVVKVLVTSLFSGVRDFLNETLGTGMAHTRVVQLSENRNQALNNLAEDQQAFTEILLLSFSDHLIVTPLSTFGGVAQAYGALTPWFVNMAVNADAPPCERGRTVDVCQQDTDKQFRCSFDSSLNERLFDEAVPFIRNCPSIDDPKGIQLVTDFQS